MRHRRRRTSRRRGKKTSARRSPNRTVRQPGGFGRVGRRI